MSMAMEGGLLPGLPDDVAFKVFVRLPSSSIPTLRTVSSLWRILFDSHRFYSESKRTSHSPSIFILRQHPSNTAAMEGLQIPLPFANHFSKPFFTATFRRGVEKGLRILTVQHWVLLLGRHLGVRVFNVLSRRWSTAPPIVYRRQEFVFGVIGARVVVVGLVDSVPDCTPMEAYDPSTNSWTALPDIPRAMHAMFLLPMNGKLVLIAKWGTIYCFYSYDPLTESWSEEEARQNRMLEVPASTSSVVVLSNGSVVRLTCEIGPPFGNDHSIEVALLPDKQQNWTPVYSIPYCSPSPFLVADGDRFFLVNTYAKHENQVVSENPNPLYPNFKVVSTAFYRIWGACIIAPGLG